MAVHELVRTTLSTEAVELTVSRTFCVPFKAGSIKSFTGSLNLKTNGEDIDFCKQLKSIGNINFFYSSNSLCYHLQEDSVLSLSKRVWRYHSFGYKIKTPSKRKLINLSIKQIRFFLIRFFKALLKFEIKYIIISFMVLINFIKLEYNYLKKNK